MDILFPNSGVWKSLDSVCDTLHVHLSSFQEFGITEVTFEHWEHGGLLLGVELALLEPGTNQLRTGSPAYYLQLLQTKNSLFTTKNHVQVQRTTMTLNEYLDHVKVEEVIGWYEDLPNLVDFFEIAMLLRDFHRPISSFRGYWFSKALFEVLHVAWEGGERLKPEGGVIRRCPRVRVTPPSQVVSFAINKARWSRSVRPRQGQPVRAIDQQTERKVLVGRVASLPHPKPSSS